MLLFLEASRIEDRAFAKAASSLSNLVCVLITPAVSVAGLSVLEFCSSYDQNLESINLLQGGVSNCDEISRENA